MRTISGKKRPGARLGQHFLTNTAVAAALAESVVLPGDTVLEIGPGKGALTRELLARATGNTGGRVIAVEKDPSLVATLDEMFAKDIRSGTLVVIEGDIRDIVPGLLGLTDHGYVLAANIPYYITGEILRQALTAAAQPRSLALLMQKEVAQRIVARNKKESILSLSVKAYGTPRLLRVVKAGNFSPSPSVDSAILLVERISRDYFDIITEKQFFDMVRRAFSSKRKLLAKNLGISAETLVACGIPEKARAENVSLSLWKKLVERTQQQ